MTYKEFAARDWVFVRQVADLKIVVVRDRATHEECEVTYEVFTKWAKEID